MKRILITGGAGFIGTNTAEYFLKKGNKVTLLDNLSRRGSDLNLGLLKNSGFKFEFYNIDVRDKVAILEHFKNNRYDIIFHLAAQTAVTTSVVNPEEDLEINILGSFNVLEAMRILKLDTILLYSSTNKVYGSMHAVKIEENNRRYFFRDFPDGIAEDCQLDFHSPYGCSKGAAEQYILDYSRIYGLNTITFRQSCIYGTKQFGIEDQGWVAWFSIAHYYGKPIVIYGNGKQVRDILYIEDLVRGYDLAIQNIDKTRGNFYNVGGGKFNLSIIEFMDLLEEISGKKVKYSFDKVRPGDQPVFVSNNSKIFKDTGWEPKISHQEGVLTLNNWVSKNKELFEKAGILDF